MLALDIARGALDLSKKEILPLRFTMSRDPAVREESYRTICAQLEGFLSHGQDVAMVNLGDVSIYATAYYIFDRLQKAGFPAKMVPGITSFSAVAAQLGWSLTEENAPLHIIPGSTDLQAALHLPGTKVLMKSGLRHRRYRRGAGESRSSGPRGACLRLRTSHAENLSRPSKSAG